mmetsp:Transcript_27077/g.32868  ORF Transcript_27077/g.32868 Transcript_27077/m.32868 type:complete len:316 (+) Transcript_27077:132-1079(+)|eukprot:CAMPEP_0204827206 /NCGR_PEP_ID=MMETSP1346-20131115/4736_1 /ASSEMBLY_ACC=CAM_ASM_000771 /TAXON_ID=215587 /ORGANISM="Aplanochytrium stocchinoi, Strain GSBS06" /LENGTH=315 /DNA_ID=CAMNT_0051955551 /DNA_START=194 /DNA_END=1141 /DNA_ORIENTATION=-
MVEKDGLLEITAADRVRIAEVEALRLRIKTKPRQSNFRVAAIIVYKNLHDGSEHTLEGTNDEPCHIGGALCAERAALLQLRLMPYTEDDIRITAVYITSDAEEYITPGMMCREFMMSNVFMDKETPIIMCGADSTLSTVKKQRLEELYPCPSPYYRMTAKEACDFQDRVKLKLPTPDSDEEKVYKLALQTSARDTSDVHPIGFGAALMFSDGHLISSFQKKAVEYGCTLDAVGQLAQAIADYPQAKPKILAQVDESGVAHAPFAPGRAFLDEHGYGDCLVLCHTRVSDDSYDLDLQIVDVNHLGPQKPNINKQTR